MKNNENKTGSGILYAFIAAALIIGILAVTAVRSAGKLSELYLDSAESSQAMTSELIAVKDCIGGAEKNLLEAFSAQDDAAELEFLNAAKADLDALGDAVSEDKFDIWEDAAPVNELIEATQLRSAVFGSVNGGSRNIARNVFFSEYQPKLKAAEEYANGLLSDARADREGISEKLSARAAVYERLCVGIGLLGISAMTFIGLYLDKKLREGGRAESSDMPEPIYETVNDENEAEGLREKLSEAEAAVANAVRALNALSEAEPDSAAEGEYPAGYEALLSAVRKMKARLKFIGTQVNRGAEFVSSEADRASDIGKRLSDTADDAGRSARLLGDIVEKLCGYASEASELSEKIGSGSEKCISAAEECGVQLGTLGGTADMLREGTNSLEAVSAAAADIAGRANRLAVSAAVNAAKGEADRNIAVFADEARGLALCASKLSEDTGAAVKLLDSGIKESCDASAAASENISRALEAARELYDGAEKIGNACGEELEMAERAKKCSGDISENAGHLGDISEDISASGKALSEQSAALGKIF